MFVHIMGDNMKHALYLMSLVTGLSSAAYANTTVTFHIDDLDYFDPAFEADFGGPVLDLSIAYNFNETFATDIAPPSIAVGNFYTEAYTANTTTLNFGNQSLTITGGQFFFTRTDSGALSNIRYDLSLHEFDGISFGNGVGIGIDLFGPPFIQSETLGIPTANINTAGSNQGLANLNHFANWDTSASNPFLLSGANYSDIEVYGSPLRASLSTQFVSGVPEPSTWLMMIMGFGLVAIASRRRRTITLSA